MSIGNLAERASRKAYFSDLDGGNILEFQFMPSELEFMEGGDFSERKPVGSYFPEFMWINGRTSPMQLQFFIDRTMASFVAGEYNQDPFSEVKRFPNKYAKYTRLDIVNMVNGLSKGQSSSGFLSTFGDKRKGQGVTPIASGYSASPHYNQPLDENVGVLKDLEALLYYVRPLGLKLGEMTIQTSQRAVMGDKGKGEMGTIKYKDYEQARFTPPPMVRFYFGAIWKEGYISEVNYNLSVLNKKLVPQRLDAKLTMVCTRWGYLSEVGSQVEAVSIDSTIQGSNQ